MPVALLTLRVLLAGVFVVAGLAKLADLSGSRAAVAGFGVPERLAAPLGTLLPVAELAVAVALLPAGTAVAAAIAAGALLAAFLVAIGRSMARGEAPDCHCFGQLHSEPAGSRALARDLALLAAAAVVAIAGWRNPGPSAVAWVGGMSGAGVVAFAGGLALAALTALTAWGLLSLLRQNGRLLLRIDELEARLDPTGSRAPAEEHRGLPLGSAAPAFHLPGLYGESVTLEALVSTEAAVMLLFTDPQCGPCNALMPQISAWQREHVGSLTIAVVTRGSIKDNRAKMREHAIGGVWLDDELEAYNAYRAPGTPSAVLIDRRGRIASDVAGGAAGISALVADATRPPSGPIVRVPPAPPRPLPIGSPAPDFELSDLAGEPLALAVPDRDTLVLFWNPGCGFCQQMLDDVRAFERDPGPGAPRLVLISTGSVADNERLELTSPIAIDQNFLAGAALGTTGTPSAILVDPQGRIASELAVGAAGVMALATVPAAREAS